LRLLSIHALESVRANFDFLGLCFFIFG